MATVQVLCPNGRRQNVKITPNTKLLQILEEVCSKQNFLPCNEFILVHGHTPLDLSLAFRFSNLPNNAKLELVKTQQSRSCTDEEVTIALQLENGERLQHAFSASTSLWDIIKHWESQNDSCKGLLSSVDCSHTPPLHPVCIYMREEVVGEAALRHTTLRKLALTSGKAVIRLMHRPINGSAITEITDTIEQEKVRQARLRTKIQQNALSLSTESSVDSTVPVQSTSSGGQQFEGLDEGKPCEDHSKRKEFEIKPTEAALVSEHVHEPVDAQDVEEEKSESMEISPGDEDATSLYASENSGQETSKPSAQSGAGLSAVQQLQMLDIPGVEIFTPDDFNSLTSQEQQMARLLAGHLLPGLFDTRQQALRTNQSTAMSKTKLPAEKKQPFAEFKFPEETKGQDLYLNELSEVKPMEFKPCDREVLVYDNSEQNLSHAVTEDVEEDFFELTETDIRSLMKDLQREASSERPLMTKAMRMAKLEERHQQYGYVMIRVQFPDGFVLQGCFRPRETVFALHKFVREHLEIKEQEFYLYVSPPQTILSDMAQTLVQANLAPASLVYFGSDQATEHSLVQSAILNVVPKKRADEVSAKRLARKQVEMLTSANTPEAAGHSGQKVNSDTGGTTTSDRTQYPGNRAVSAPGSDAKMPKWVKLGKK